MTILFVDDDVDEVFLFTEAVRRVDPSIVVSTALDGVEAIELLTNATVKPDHIILDINMPRMGGMECLKTIRTELKLKTPITIFSTTITPRHEALCLQYDAECMTKPNSYVSLIELVKKKVQSIKKSSSEKSTGAGNG